MNSPNYSATNAIFDKNHDDVETNHTHELIDNNAFCECKIYILKIGDLLPFGLVTSEVRHAKCTNVVNKKNKKMVKLVLRSRMKTN